MRIALAAFYLAAGLLHLHRPESFLLITPDWVPYPREVILLTGMCEIAGAVGLFIPRCCRAAGIALALYALAVWPANFKHALEAIDVPALPSTWWYHGPRLALQPVLIWWALFASGVIDWPTRKRAADQ